MSLAKCKACGHEVSKKADKCPNCGEPLKRKSVGCGGAIGAVFLFVVIWAAVSSITDRQEGSTTPKPPLTAAEQRVEQISGQFSAWDGSHRSLEKSVKVSLKDPDSYQHVETSYIDKGSEGIDVVMTYRAKNSFGGYVVNRAAATYDIDGNLLKGPTSLDE